MSKEMINKTTTDFIEDRNRRIKEHWEKRSEAFDYPALEVRRRWKLEHALNPCFEPALLSTVETET